MITRMRGETAGLEIVIRKISWCLRDEEQRRN